MYKKEAVLRILDEIGIDAVIITDPYNMRYYSGFTGGEGCYYVSHSSCALLTDSRYTLWARSECEPDEVYTVADRGFAKLNEFIDKDGVKKLGLEGSNLSYDDYMTYIDRLNAAEVVSVKDELTGPRMIKTAEEIDNIAKAEAIGDEAFEYILSILKPGMTEKEVAMELEMYMRSNGADALSFEVIAASGLNSARPHATPSDKKLEYGDFLTMDFGCVYKGYCSDMTRTVVIGRADEKQGDIYKLVLEAQMLAINNLRAGITGKCADAYARDVITKAGYGDYFGHGLGHSLGLYIHEEPRLSMREDRILEPGMVVTVEPGIYIEGFGGVRIEDVVVIEDNGVRNLTGSPKELIELV